jgi:hypothetical protein
MSPNANLYLDRMDLAGYAGGPVCSLCRVDSFADLIERIRSGERAQGLCPHWPAWRREAFRLAVSAGEYLPGVPALEFPRPAEVGVIELNGAGPASPVLVSGNSEFTQAVLLAVVSRTVTPLRLLLVDTLGHTVDMALVFGEFKVGRTVAGLEGCGAGAGSGARVILPGLAWGLAPEVSAALGREVEVGPVCAAELPLYLGPAWLPASASD